MAAKVIGALVVIFLTPFALAAGCLALLAAGGGSSRIGDLPVAVEDSVTQQATKSPAPPEQAAPPAPGLNTPVRDGKFEFVVTNVQTGERARGNLTIVTMTVKNIADQPRSFLPFSQTLYDTQGRQFGHDVIETAQQTQASGTQYTFALQPGQTTTAQLVFGIPHDTTPSHIILRDFVLSLGTTVSLR